MASSATWGLIPHRAKEPKTSYSTINCQCRYGREQTNLAFRRRRASSRPMDPTKWSQSKARSPVSLTNMSGLVPGAGDDGEPYIASVPTPRPPPVRFKFPETYGRRFLEKRIAYQLQEIEFRKVNPELFERNRQRIEALIKAGESKKPSEASG